MYKRQADKRDERLADVIAWLGFVVRSVDSSLVDEWESAGAVSYTHLDVYKRQPMDAIVPFMWLASFCVMLVFIGAFNISTALGGLLALVGFALGMMLSLIHI